MTEEIKAMLSNAAASIQEAIDLIENASDSIQESAPELPLLCKLGEADGNCWELLNSLESMMQEG